MVNKSKVIPLIAGLITATAITAAIGSLIYTGMARYQETTLKKLDAKGKADDEKYLAFTTDGVYENTDNWFFLKFGSSDVQNQMIGKEGYEVRLKVRGWRFKPMSWYENIHDVEILSRNPDMGLDRSSETAPNTGLEIMLTNPHNVPFDGPIAMTSEILQTMTDYQKENSEVGLIPVVKKGVITNIIVYDAKNGANAKEYVREVSELVNEF